MLNTSVECVCLSTYLSVCACVVVCVGLLAGAYLCLSVLVSASASDICHFVFGPLGDALQWKV